MNIFGKTGAFPEGKLAPADEGEITIGVGTNMEHKLVVIQLGTPVAWLAMTPNEARVLGIGLLKSANCVEGVVMN